MLVGFFVLFLVVVVIVFVWRFVARVWAAPHDSASPPDDANIVARVKPRPRSGAGAATDGRFMIAPRDFADFPFAIAEGVTGLRLVGRFRATGGEQNRISLYVLTDAQYRKWQEQEPTLARYASKLVTGGTVNLYLPSDPANYHVVFDNRALPYAKAIETDLEWQWTNFAGRPGENRIP
jgi:hypothetical protein